MRRFNVFALVALTLAATLVQASAATSASWAQAAPAQSPQGREFAAMTFDSRRGRAVLFGGGAGAMNSYLADTWEWSGTAWSLVLPALSPPGLIGHAMAYDSSRGRTVLFGGQASQAAPRTSDTWEWDGTNWVHSSPTATPPARFWHAMTYDSARSRLVLFGGSGQAGDLADTWTYDGTTWTQRFPASSPPARYGHAMAFDSLRGKVVLFGGRANGSRVADTWEWDGTNWTQSSPTSAPYARFWHAMAFDSQRGKTVLFGGDHIRPYALGPIDDTWLWDGTEWTQVFPTTKPRERAEHTMAYDSVRRRTVLFGGSNELNPATLYTDTWELVIADVPKADQTISLSPLADQTFGATAFNINATSSSGLAVTFAAAGQCSVAGSTVTITGGGSCSITASQPGNADYNAATPVTRSFNIACFPARMVFALPGTGAVLPATLTFAEQQPVARGGCTGSFTLTTTIGPSTVTAGTGSFSATTAGTVASGALTGTMVPPLTAFTFNATLNLDTAAQTGTITESFTTPDGPVTIGVTFVRTAGTYVIAGVKVTP
jgi:hypothetical protein